MGKRRPKWNRRQYMRTCTWQITCIHTCMQTHIYVYQSNVLKMQLWLSCESVSFVCLYRNWQTHQLSVLRHACTIYIYICSQVSPPLPNPPVVVVVVVVVVVIVVVVVFHHGAVVGGSVRVVLKCQEWLSKHADKRRPKWNRRQYMHTCTLHALVGGVVAGAVVEVVVRGSMRVVLKC